MTLGEMSSSRLSSASVFSPVRIRWTAVRLNSVLKTRLPSAFRRCSPMGPPAASYVPTVSSRNGEHSTAVCNPHVVVPETDGDGQWRLEGCVQRRAGQARHLRAVEDLHAVIRRIRDVDDALAIHRNARWEVVQAEGIDGGQQARHRIDIVKEARADEVAEYQALTGADGPRLEHPQCKENCERHEPSDPHSIPPKSVSGRA